MRLRSGQKGGGPAGDERLGHGRSERTAGSGVARPHRSGGDVAAGKEPGDDAAVEANDASVAIRRQPALGAVVAVEDRDGEEGRLGQRREAGIGSVFRIAIGAAMPVGAAPEIGILAVAGG